MYNKAIYTIYSMAQSQMGGEREPSILDWESPLYYFGKKYISKHHFNHLMVAP